MTNRSTSPHGVRVTVETVRSVAQCREVHCRRLDLQAVDACRGPAFEKSPPRRAYRTEQTYAEQDEVGEFGGRRQSGASKVLRYGSARRWSLLAMMSCALVCPSKSVGCSFETILGTRLRTRHCDCSFVLAAPVQTSVGRHAWGCTSFARSISELTRCQSLFQGSQIVAAGRRRNPVRSPRDIGRAIQQCQRTFRPSSRIVPPRVLLRLGDRWADPIG